MRLEILKAHQLCARLPLQTALKLFSHLPPAASGFPHNFHVFTLMLIFRNSRDVSVGEMPR
jgi:hypothetical protein